MVKYQQKVAGILECADSASIKELKTIEDLSPYRDWIIKVIKSTNKLQ